MWKKVLLHVWLATWVAACANDDEQETPVQYFSDSASSARVMPDEVSLTQTTSENTASGQGASESALSSLNSSDSGSGSLVQSTSLP